MENKAIGFIEEQTWIDRAADPLHEGVRGVLRRMPRLAAFLHGDWLGHPLHPALVEIPVGAWATALVLDGMGLGRRGRRYHRAADVVTGVGFAGAVAAVPAGLADWSRTEGDAKRVGFVHLALNSVVATLYAGSLIARAKERRALGVALSVAGFSLAGMSAWLGGELSFRFAVGVRPRPEARTAEPASSARTHR